MVDTDWIAALDRYIDALRGMPGATGRAVRAIDHAEASRLPPLEMHLAGTAAAEAAEGVTEHQWLSQHMELGWKRSITTLPHGDAPNRLGQAIANLMEAGLWPW